MTVLTEDKSQREVVKEHLLNQGAITPKQAMINYGIMRLSARIRELRQDGMDIKTEQDGPHDYATYSLREED